MNRLPSGASRPAFRLGLGSLVLASVLALFAGCAGGDGSDGVGSGGTGTYSQGPITGFGSIIVNGVRFDDSVATVIDDDDVPRSRSDLRLGMIVEVEGGAVRTEASGRAATANRVRFGSALVGPVASVDVAAGTLAVLGQTVRVGAGTVVDDRLAGGLAALAAGRVVEVHGLYDVANARFVATRIEPAPVGAAWQVRGPVASVDTAARVLRIGPAAFAYAGASAVPAALAAGDIVRLRLRDEPDAPGRYRVDAFLAGVRAPEDRDSGEIEGTITAFTSTTRFRVGALTVDASGAAFPDGTAGLRAGARVEVEGVLRAGVLRARTVEIASEDEVEDRSFRLEGAITAVDAQARTFVLRGQVVGYGRPGLQLDDGTLADIAVGREVRVEARPTADRSRLEAVRLRFP